MSVPLNGRQPKHVTLPFATAPSSCSVRTLLSADPIIETNSAHCCRVEWRWHQKHLAASTASVVHAFIRLQLRRALPHRVGPPEYCGHRSAHRLHEARCRHVRPTNYSLHHLLNIILLRPKRHSSWSNQPSVADA